MRGVSFHRFEPQSFRRVERPELDEVGIVSVGSARAQNHEVPTAGPLHHPSHSGVDVGSAAGQQKTSSGGRADVFGVSDDVHAHIKLPLRKSIGDLLPVSFKLACELTTQKNMVRHEFKLHLIGGEFKVEATDSAGLSSGIAACKAQCCPMALMIKSVPQA